MRRAHSNIHASASDIFLAAGRNSDGRTKPCKRDGYRDLRERQVAVATAWRIECPKEIGEKTIQLVATGSGWTPYQSSSLRLNSAAPTGGPPELHADLAQFTTKHNKTARIDTYDLSPPHPGGIWTECGYGASNEITLHKQLNDNIRQCTITQKNAAPSAIDIVCR